MHPTQSYGSSNPVATNLKNLLPEALTRHREAARCNHFDQLASAAHEYPQHSVPPAGKERTRAN
eukprot:3565222-Karenia_brevis.AAC.1